MKQILTLLLDETIISELWSMVEAVNEEEQLTYRPNDIMRLASEIINYALGVDAKGKIWGMPDPMADEVYESYINLKQGNGDLNINVS